MFFVPAIGVEQNRSQIVRFRRAHSISKGLPGFVCPDSWQIPLPPHTHLGRFRMHGWIKTCKNAPQLSPCNLRFVCIIWRFQCSIATSHASGALPSASGGPSHTSGHYRILPVPPLTPPGRYRAHPVAPLTPPGRYRAHPVAPLTPPGRYRILPVPLLTPPGRYRICIRCPLSHLRGVTEFCRCPLSHLRGVTERNARATGVNNTKFWSWERWESVGNPHALSALSAPKFCVVNSCSARVALGNAPEVWEGTAAKFGNAPEVWEGPPDALGNAPEVWEGPPDALGNAPEVWEGAPDALGNAPEVWEPQGAPVKFGNAPEVWEGAPVKFGKPLEVWEGPSNAPPDVLSNARRRKRGDQMRLIPRGVRRGNGDFLKKQKNKPALESDCRFQGPGKIEWSDHGFCIRAKLRNFFCCAVIVS